MSLQSLADLLRQSKEMKAAAEVVKRGRAHIFTGLSGGQRSAFLSSIYDNTRVMLVVTPSLDQSEKLARDLTVLNPDCRALIWEGNELMPYEEALPALDLKRERLQVLQWARKPGTVIFAPVGGLLEGLTPPEGLVKSQFSVNTASQFDLVQLGRLLVKLGYERTAAVEGPGQFSIRGGIVDISSFNLNRPIRLEFFADQVDSLRTFCYETQRSEQMIPAAVIGAARETLYDFEKLPRIREKIWEAAQNQSERLYKLIKGEEADHLLAQTARHLELFQERGYFPGIDQYKMFFGKLFSLLDYLPSDTLLVLDEPIRLREAAEHAYLEINENISVLIERGRVLPNLAELYFDWSTLFSKFQKYNPIYLSVLGKRVSGMEKASSTSFGLRMPEHFSGSIERMLRRVKRWRQESYRILILVSAPARGSRILELLREEGIPAVYVDQLQKELKLGNCIITTGSLESGFEFSPFKLVVLTELELYGRPRAKAKPTKIEEGLKIAPHELRAGDYVVHINHGIGQYLGIEPLVVDNRSKDYLHIRYAGQDRLYVPTDQIDLLQRYIGLEEGAPRLSKLGGNEWVRAKKRAKESVRDLAQGLIELYAERQAIPGFAFAEDAPWQRDFESTFPYQETPDQLQAIEAVKSDMEKPRPMDRLLCGDVGYGKTEVAVRASFKAVTGDKQVAVLVPTTILAQQHQRTFLERFEGFPINVAVISRFQSQQQISKTLKEIKSGTVDVVIGTHRLLSSDVKFKDLGLVIVDEEQRFGVAQKEWLKRISTAVDVLTLSATPIPRTLHMAMVGVRDMSVIATAPEDRYPIRTYVVEYDEQLVRQAILRELARQGQIYFVHNRVRSMDYMYSKLRELVPEARIAVAHGQMDENVLERVMLDFYRGEFDILLCTTIIENGMDIANVNTLIVDNADHFGLAQLYQLRGRVGRTNRVAYAYFTHRRDRVLTEDAEKRLGAIKEFTELGSGIRIAMRDLEIRGAGNLLGSEQHGFIAAVGFELYTKLLEESIRELKGEETVKPPEPVLELQVDAYIDDQYVNDPAQKVEIYQKIIALNSLKECDELEEEIRDRYGALPDAMDNLVQIGRIRVLSRFTGVSNIIARENKFEIKFLEGLAIDAEKYLKLHRLYRGKLSYRHGKVGRLELEKTPHEQQSLGLLSRVLSSIRDE